MALEGRVDVTFTRADGELGGVYGREARLGGESANLFVHPGAIAQCTISEVGCRRLIGEGESIPPEGPSAKKAWRHEDGRRKAPLGQRRHAEPHRAQVGVIECDGNTWSLREPIRGSEYVAQGDDTMRHGKLVEVALKRG
ncbi:MAG TPA: hypothetical protein VML95_06080 [Longimicrobiales bacterium]|nr:hypothetical protein [Longimicrobiales bacterium]